MELQETSATIPLKDSELGPGRASPCVFFLSLCFEGLVRIPAELQLSLPLKRSTTRCFLITFLRFQSSQRCSSFTASLTSLEVEIVFLQMKLNFCQTFVFFLSPLFFLSFVFISNFKIACVSVCVWPVGVEW